MKTKANVAWCLILAISILMWLFLVYRAFSQPAPPMPSFVVPAPLERSIEVAWDASPDTNVTGYALYIGTNSGGPYQFRVDAEMELSVRVYESNLFVGQTNYMVAVSYNSSSVESLPSNEINPIYDPDATRPAPPAALKQTFIIRPRYYYSTNGTEWFLAAYGDPVVLNTELPVKFVRVKNDIEPITMIP